MNGDNRRQSKWKRAGKPDPLILQPRDLEIIQAVYEFGLLTREQIQRLFVFNCVTRANIRLRKLFDHGCLSRRFLPSLNGSSMAIYFLGPKGIEIVAEKNSLDLGSVKKRQKNLSSKKEYFFNHDLMVNEIRIAFRQSLTDQDGSKLECWVNAVDCLLEYATTNEKSGHQEKKIFRPDGYFRFIYDGKLFGCFLEMDASTMSNRRFQSKVKVYLDYARSGLYQQRYGLNFFRVLVVTKTKERLLNLKSATEKITDKVFWFATIDDVSNDVSGRIWSRPGNDNLHYLLEQ